MAVLLSLCSFSRAQTTVYCTKIDPAQTVVTTSAVGSFSRPASGAKLWVCAAGSLGTAPCVPLSNLYTTTGTLIKNPMTSDSHGNFDSVCVDTPGRYMFQVGGTGFTTVVTDGLIIPGDPANTAGIGSCTNQFVTALNNAAAPTCKAVAPSDTTGTTGSGTVFALQTSPIFTTPNIGAATATTVNKVTITAPVTGATLTIADGKTATVNNSLTLAGTDSTTMTFPSASDTVVGLTATQTLTNKTLTSPTVTSPSTTGTDSGTETLQNKRVEPRVSTLTSSTTFTPASDSSDVATMTMTGVAGTLTIAAPTGTPVDGQKLILRIKTTNAQTYSFNATYRFSASVTAPSTTTAGKTDYFGCMWNATDSKWDVVAYDGGH